MTPKYIVKFCDDPKKYPQNLHTPKIFFFLLKTQKSNYIQNFEPPKMTRAYVCMKISETSPRSLRDQPMSL